jgi:methionyl-tRNA formyltransferase
MKPKIVIICALENGKVALDYFSNLNKKGVINLIKVYTYKDKLIPNKNMYIRLDNIIGNNILTKVGKINDYKDEIKELNPDFIFVIGWSQLINKEIINASKKGTIGFHTSKLPKDRGRSTIAWQISEGYTETALTMFYISKGIDNGDIIAQENIKIEQDDYVKDILFKINQSTYNLLKTYFPLLVSGKAPRIKQDETQASYRKLRTDNDSLINWNSNTDKIYNLIRAVSFPYPKAWTLNKGEKIKINKASVVNFLPKNLCEFEISGTILGNLKGYGYLIKTKNGIIAINDLEQKDIYLLTGKILGR